MGFESNNLVTLELYRPPKNSVNGGITTGFYSINIYQVIKNAPRVLLAAVFVTPLLVQAIFTTGRKVYASSQQQSSIAMSTTGQQLPTIQLKVQYSYQQETTDAADANHLLAAQFTCVSSY